MSVTVTTLLENTLSAHKGLRAEHGLSFHVRTPNATFLFDCGPGPNLLHNAAQLQIDLRRLDFVVCSHAHYDHANGFRHTAELSGVRRLITGVGFFDAKYAVQGMKSAYIGPDFDTQFLIERGIGHETVSDITLLDDGCWLLGNFERTEELENAAGQFAVRCGGELSPDAFHDEICLAVRLEDGLAVLVGCAHPGILNILTTVKKRLNLPIRGVWGGTHLHDADDHRLARTAAGLKALGVKYAGYSHCSGDRAADSLAGAPGLAVSRLATGDAITLVHSQF